MRLFMKSVLLLVAVIALCLCAAQAATPTPTGGAAKVVKVPSSPAAAQATLSTVASLPADTTATPVSKATTQVPRSTASPEVRTTTPRPPATTTATATQSAAVTTPQTTTVPTTPGSNLPVPVPTVSAGSATLTPWPNATTYEYTSPTESRTPDIDPGMTPYSGPTLFETVEPTPTWEVPGIVASGSPTDPPMAMPYITTEAFQSPTFEFPPGAYSVEPSPSPTGTVAPFPSAAPLDAAGSSFLPRWGSYLLFILLGIAGVALLALGGSHLGTRPAGETVVAPAPPRAKEVRLLQPGAPEPTMEQQVLIDRIAGFAPQSMHVERLGKNLLRFERGAQVDAQDRSLRLGQLLDLSAIPSAPAPAPASAWARAHGFRILAVDGSGMALVMAALSNGGRSVLGVLPVGEMVEGASPVPMPVLPEDGERGGRTHPASFTGVGAL